MLEKFQSSDKLTFDFIILEIAVESVDWVFPGADNRELLPCAVIL